MSVLRPAAACPRALQHFCRALPHALPCALCPATRMPHHVARLPSPAGLISHPAAHPCSPCRTPCRALPRSVAPCRALLLHTHAPCHGPSAPYCVTCYDSCHALPPSLLRAHHRALPRTCHRAHRAPAVRSQL
ncbi:unnamed protein product [Closterium sp. NIES-54]